MSRPELFYRVPDSGDFRACLKCGVPIAFGVTDKGKRVPLDLSTLKRDDRRDSLASIGPDGGPPWVARTHFQTCPFAKDFTRKGK